MLKMIAGQSGFQLLAARVHRGDHVHVFVSAAPKASVPEMVRVFKCVSEKCCLRSSRRVSCSFGVGICGRRGMLLEVQAS